VERPWDVFLRFLARLPRSFFAGARRYMRENDERIIQDIRLRIKEIKSVWGIISTRFSRGKLDSSRVLKEFHSAIRVTCGVTVVSKLWSCYPVKSTI